MKKTKVFNVGTGMMMKSESGQPTECEQLAYYTVLALTAEGAIIAARKKMRHKGEYVLEVELVATLD